MNGRGTPLCAPSSSISFYVDRLQREVPDVAKIGIIIPWMFELTSVALVPLLMSWKSNCTVWVLLGPMKRWKFCWRSVSVKLTVKTGIGCGWLVSMTLKTACTCVW